MKNVYLFYEPDSEKLAEDIHLFLSNLRGKIYEFHKPQLLPDTSYLPSDPNTAVYKDEFFAQMKKLKELLASSIKEEDYIVFINTRRVGNRPFSEIDFENYHIMVDGSRHNYIMPNAPQWLAVSYLIVVSLLLRSFFVDEISVVNARHEGIPTGCFMDFNGNKMEIRTNMYTGYICWKCMQTMMANKSDVFLLQFFVSALESVRKELIMNELEREVPIETIPIELVPNLEKGQTCSYKIIIADYFVPVFKPVQFSIFLYFLYLRYKEGENPRGISLIQIEKAAPYLRRIYKKIKTKGGKEIDEELNEAKFKWVDTFCKQTGKKFNSQLSTTNASISDTIGYNGLEKFLRIEKRGEDKYALGRGIDITINDELKKLFNALDQMRG